MSQYFIEESTVRGICEKTKGKLGDDSIITLADVSEIIGNLENVNKNYYLDLINGNPIETLILPDNISLRTQALGKSSIINDLIIPKNVDLLGNTSTGGCFASANIKNAIIKGCVTVGKYCFNKAPLLESVTLEEGVKTITYGAFAQIPKLKYLYFPDSVETFEGYIMHGSVLEEISIGPNIKSINSRAFEGLPAGAVIDCRFCQGDIAGAPWGAPSGVTVRYMTRKGLLAKSKKDEVIIDDKDDGWIDFEGTNDKMIEVFDK